MIQQNYSDIVTDDLLVNSLDHAVHPGFLEDYRVITALLRIHEPTTIFEVGTNTGNGVNVMAIALPEAKIYSLDLDYKTMMQDSKQYPIGRNGEDRVGSAAKFPYTQLRGNSLEFDYSKYPCEAYFVDGEHTWVNVFTETSHILKNNPKLIIFHDADVEGVYKGVVDAFKENSNYELYRVIDTRIAYAIRK